ncbi:MAG: peptide chain release factor N(5)-glutamine methyltransferase [Proteobacteria bacterium]|nr:peptide chain release factor N(5)-glutamine methyltransferase [Pseudomonadota bacterium]
MNNKQAIEWLCKQFASISDSARLDAEILMAHVLQRPRSWLRAHDDQALTQNQWLQLGLYSERRIKGEPIAYILGSKEFWSLELNVSPAVLIPRPETELLVEWVLDRFPKNTVLKVLDLGTGSGTIAIALAKERCQWTIDATDQSLMALDLAKKNSQTHRLTNINFYHGDWYQPLAGKKYDVIVSNPPYLANQDPHLKQLTFEPYEALVAGEQGFEDLQIIIEKAQNHLLPSGYLVLEHGYDQSQKVISFLEQKNLINIQVHQDYSGHPRFATAQLPSSC